MEKKKQTKNFPLASQKENKTLKPKNGSLMFPYKQCSVFQSKGPVFLTSPRKKQKRRTNVTHNNLFTARGMQTGQDFSQHPVPNGSHSLLKSAPSYSNP